jgi:hypothetical protein
MDSITRVRLTRRCALRGLGLAGASLLSGLSLAACGSSATTSVATSTAVRS